MPFPAIALQIIQKECGINKLMRSMLPPLLPPSEGKISLNSFSEHIHHRLCTNLASPWCQPYFLSLDILILRCLLFSGFKSYRTWFSKISNEHVTFGDVSRYMRKSGYYVVMFMEINKTI